MPTDPNAGDTNDGFFLINPAIENPAADPAALVSIGSGVDVFVSDNDFQYPYAFDIDSPLIGVGVELRSVTGLDADFAQDVADTDAFLDVAYLTTVGAVDGTASFVDGVLTNLCFDAELTLTYDTILELDPLPPRRVVITETGSISFRGDRFAMLVADPGYERDDPAERIDSNGNGSGDDDGFDDPGIGDAVDPDYVWDIFGRVENVTLSAPGDFDGDGSVTVLDYQLWVSQFGEGGGHADANHDCVVDAADYTIWRDSFAAAASAASTAVPEPLFLLQLAAAAGVSVWARTPRPPRASAVPNPSRGA